MVLAIDMILQEQDKEGLFPTYRAKKGEKIVQSSHTEVKNIGIHTFVLEGLLELDPDSSKIKASVQNGLNYLIKEAVNYDGVYLWRWLKNPNREDYMYPPDYDDTARARTLIEIGMEKDFDIPMEFREFDYEELLQQGLTQHGVFTFIGNKPGNIVCPIVNTNIINSYRRYLKNRDIDPNDNKTFKKIRRYLVEVINSTEFQLPNFSRLSKFYSSHSLFAYLISKIDAFDTSVLDVVRKRIEKEEGRYKNSLEAALGTLALINLRGNEKFIGKGIRQIQESAGESDLWNPEQFYQHQRLGHVFGSSAGTSIFCLEALNKFERT